MDISTGTSVLLVAVSICGYIALRSSSKKKDDKSPPCLPSFPIIGSLPFLGGVSNLHVTLTEKYLKYGRIFSLYAGSKYVVVLNGHELIREALIKTAAELAGRGEMYIEKNIWPDHGKGVIMINSGDTQRKTRSNCQIVLKNFGFGSRKIMEVRIHEEASRLVEYIHRLDGKPWYPAFVLEQCTFNNIYNLMFSKRFDYDDPRGKDIIDISHKFAASVDAIHDVFPIITKLPNVQRTLADARRTYDKYLHFMETAIEESLTTEDDDNFVKEFIKVNGKEDLDKRNLAVILRDLIIAGTETTASTINWTLILLANHPEVQSRLQKEIDAVIASDQLPSFEDKTKLTYMEAVILETLRLRTTLPISLPHMTTADTEIDGYHIPAGTEIIVNLHSAHMDPNVWIEPEKFNPSRFLDKDGSLINKERMIAFSLGKRSCLGEVLARQQLFLLLSVLVQNFNILPPEGESKVNDGFVFARTLTAVKHTMRLVARN